MNRIDEATMNSILDRWGESAPGRILRLAWQAGLRRREIRDLTWGSVDLMEWKISLPDRTVPIPMELALFLAPLEEEKERFGVASQRTGDPLDPQTISHLAKEALAEGGLPDVRLTDLRTDCALRMLCAGQDWQAVSRATGMSAAALRKLGGQSTRAVKDPRVKAAAVEQLLEREGATPAGAAIALAWRIGLGLDEILELKWEAVDTLPLDSRTKTLLEGLERQGPFVLSTRTGRPYDRARLSRLVRSAFVQGGLDDLTLRDLRQLRSADAFDAQLLLLAGRREGVTLQQAQEELDLVDTAVRRSLRRLVQKGKLVRVGMRYYLPGAVVPPEEQEAAILDYLKREGFAYRQDIARLLRLPPAQCRPVLQRMVESGKLHLEEQRYIMN